MRVLIIPSWYAAAGSESITGLVFREHALLLRQKGVDAMVAHGSFSWKGIIKTTAQLQDEDGVPTLRIKGWNPPKLYKFLVKSWIHKYADSILDYFKLNGQPDVIHAQGYQAGWVAEFINEKTSIPYIITEHFSGFLLQNIPIVHHQFIKTAFDNADHVTAVSPGLKAALKIYTDNSIEVVPNYYNPKIFYHDPTVKKSEVFQWLSIGEPIHVKGLDVLLESFHRVMKARPNMNMRLVLADDIPDRHMLEVLAEKLEIEDKIEFAGLLPPDQLADLIRRSHVLVSSSRFETFGRTIMEGNACGIPVVATRTVGSSYILSSTDQGILCEVESVDSLSQAMMEMISRYPEYKAEKIQSIIASRFNADIVLEEWIKLYKEVADV
jgi:glycosyltransferase involved in cell wall biosynthesis